MDLEANDDQQLLIESSVRFMESECPLEAVRKTPFDGGNQPGGYWQTGAELGWFGFLVPDSLGGGSISDEGMLDAALIGYSRGRLLQPGPYVGTNVVAYAIAEAGSVEQRENTLKDLIGGERSAGWAVAHEGDDLFAGVRAEATSDGFRLSGSRRLLYDIDESSVLLVTAVSEAGPVQFLLPVRSEGLRCEPVEGLDISRRFYEVHLDGVPAPASAMVGAPDEVSELADRQLAVACVLTAAESVGAMDRDLSVAVQYAKDRIAFGRPIGSFQAVKHLLADTSLWLEMSKAIVIAAARAFAGPVDPDLRPASMAKAFVGDCGIDLGQNCFQVFGGIGFTWEHDQHLYLRRLTMDAALFGQPAWHRERLCRMAGM